MSAETCGFLLKGRVPRTAGTTPKLCRKCNQWFAQRPGEQLCDGCLTPNQRSSRLALMGARPLRQVCPESNDQRLSPTPGYGQYSNVLGVWFRDDVSACRILAFEEAARRDGKRKALTAIA